MITPAIPFRPCAQTGVPLLVRFADVDMMQIVHHTAYIHWFEQVRFNFLWNVMGLDWKVVRDLGLKFPVTECRVKYIRAVGFGDRVVGYAQIERHQRAMFTFHYQICDANQPSVMYALGSTSHCYLDAAGKLLLHTPEIISTAFDEALVRYPDCAIPASVRA